MDISYDGGPGKEKLEMRGVPTRRYNNEMDLAELTKELPALLAIVRGEKTEKVEEKPNV